MVSSLGVVVLYWGWYAYHSNDSDDMSYVYDDMTGLGLIVTLIFLVLLIPVCLHYRSIELQQGGGSQSVDRERQGDIKTRRNQHRQDRHRNRERSPPPKYHESKFTFLNISSFISKLCPLPSLLSSPLHGCGGYWYWQPWHPLNCGPNLTRTLWHFDTILKLSDIDVYCLLFQATQLFQQFLQAQPEYWTMYWTWDEIDRMSIACQLMGAFLDVTYNDCSKHANTARPSIQSFLY